MKKILLLLFLFLTLISNEAFANENTPVIIPIKSEINSAMATYVRDSIKNAEDKKSPLIIFEIDTYGGSIIAAEKIKNYIIDSKIPTVAFVNNKAESAGVLITIACKNVYMSKTATIGSAETIPKTEKNISFWKGMLRDTAQYRGRNEQIIESMADSDIYIPMIIEKGKLTNLTSKESLDLGISDGVANNYEDILKQFNLDGKKYEIAKMDLTVKVINIVSNQTVSTILLILGMLGFVVEIFTPGFGVGGIISIIAFSLFFIGNLMAGNSNWYSIVIFLVGIVLIIIEIIIPGFGIVGIGGIIFVISGLVLAMKTLEIAITSIAIALIITILCGIYLIKKGKKLKFINNVTLSKSCSSEDGYISVDYAKLDVGRNGKTISILRPTGYIEIDGKKYEAIAYNGFIEKDVEVVVCKIEAFKIFVRRKEE
ncbi:nodulation protein NfeD [Peptoniphilus sp. oral taxon 386]|uniref:NfeD family protein n=1 Tax=Peptoniphilus sp. oral taxon 386 TaxID=652713 RepID=UPI0001DA9BD0|nr:NfeD family protein [Peptoniphilus sp. oral taxon 386]EFI42386.1 nodulation efficiency protein D [Peptoniphilus sp. oral taxon 386 str. F0131]